MGRFNAVPYEEESEINLSPMLDVVFIMLIFFIVVASFTREDGLPVTTLDGYLNPDTDIESINVTVESDGVFLVNRHILAAGSVYPYVAALRAENPDAGFLVILAAKSRVKDAAVAIDAGRRIGEQIVQVTDKTD